MRRWELPAPLLVFLLFACQRAEPSFRVVPQVGPVTPRRVAFSPADASQIVVVEANGLVGVWNVDRLTQPSRRSAMGASALEARFSTDGHDVVTAGRDGTLRWWNLDGRLLHESHGGHAGNVNGIAVHPRWVASAGADGTIRLWNRDGSPAGEPIEGHEGMVLSVALSRDGDVASFGIDQTVRVWKRSQDHGYRMSGKLIVSNPRLTRLLPSLLALDVNWGWGRSVVFLPSADRLAVAAFDATVRILNSEAILQGAPLFGHRAQAQSIAVSSSGDLVASVGHDGELRLWPSSGPSPAKSIRAHGGAAFSVDFSPAGDRLVTTGGDDIVKFWNRDGEQLGALPQGRRSAITCVAFAADGQTLAAADDRGRIRMWNLDGSPRGNAFKAHEGRVNALTFSPNGDVLASGGNDAAVRLWDQRGTLLPSPSERHLAPVSAIAFSPSGDLVASGGRNHPIRLWRRSTASADPRGLGGLRDIVNAISFSPDGTLVAAASSDSEIGIWAVGGPWSTGAILTHGGFVTDVHFSPRGDFVASAGKDGSIRLWNRDGSARGEPLAEHRGTVHSIAFSPAGDLLASGGDDGTIRLWKPAEGELRQLDVGTPVQQVGFRGGRLWARLSGGELRFYGGGHQQTATMLIEPNSALVFTAKGWYSGSGRLLETIRMFDAERPLNPVETRERESADKVMAEIRG